ncbi:hypothetical protein [Mameliella sediminis]|uniref:hypothetical protein n=1 Tax=Mameliella sediminis TaxID=2836866 RepID=UPI001C465768|nr:hypothetical protein [Mameliella sediminis]MBV7392966.1 hypothetical protein [Mameliella sediminis]
MSGEARKSDGARAKLYLDGPLWEGAPAATIGDFKCDSAEEGAALLRDLCGEMKAGGVTRVLGPMNGDTWHSYRLVTESDGTAPFLMEPKSGPHDLAAFEAAGFTPVSHYFSAHVAPETGIGPQPAPMPGIEIANWDGSAPEAHFAEVHALSSQAFSGNAFYQPIGLQDFLALYMPFVPLLKPDLIFTARDTATGALLGYLFGIPNYGHGASPEQVILKTYASLRHGLGHHLARAFHIRARDMGFQQVIHALIHDDNASADRSRRHGGQVFRRYALMGRHLDD